MVQIDINSVIIAQNLIKTTIIKNIHLSLSSKKVYGILGPNGVGKSTLLYSFTGLLDKRFYTIDGKIVFDGKDILKLSEPELLQLRRKKIKYIFQDAASSFDPLKKIGYYFKQLSIKENQLYELLEYFLLPEKSVLANKYSYELSGGMAQRLRIVIALAQNPDLLILDEPTSAVDTPIANLICSKLKEFVKEENKTVLFVTQNINFAKNTADYLTYLGKKTKSLTQFYEADKFVITEGNQ